MAAALDASGRTILYSMCEWGRENPAVWASEIANSWRVTMDIRDSWHSIISRANIDAPLWRYAGPGGWNDPDMLEVGNGGCSFEEYKTHFSLWAMLKSPLIIGNDIRDLKVEDEAMQILTNQEVIAINQDVLGLQARRIWSDT
jgi:alpha-galactosidase